MWHDPANGSQKLHVGYAPPGRLRLPANHLHLAQAQAACHSAHSVTEHAMRLVSSTPSMLMSSGS
jgi:hypothetical protein